MLKQIKFIFLLIIIGISYYYYGKSTNPISKDLPVIALSQIIEHDTLDVVREGFLKEFSEQGYKDGENVRIVYENAHGNLTTSVQITTRFASLAPKILIGLSTQSGQSMLKLAQSQKIPLVFTAVTNPVAAKLLKKDGSNLPYVTGVSDFMAPDPQIDLIVSFVPHLKTIGVLYNPSEVNSVSYLEQFKIAAEKRGLKVVYAPLSSINEAATAALSLVGKVDAAYFPNDNTAMAGVKSIVQVLQKHKVPLFANDVESVKKGVLAALSYDRILMGRRTAQLALRILKGESADNIPAVYDVPYETVYNFKALAKIGLALPTLKNGRDVGK